MITNAETTRMIELAKGFAIGAGSQAESTELGKLVLKFVGEDVPDKPETCEPKP